MDPSRFGRVLGIGTRLAARTLVSAATAASAENPSSARTASTAPAPAQPAQPAQPPPPSSEKPHRIITADSLRQRTAQTSARASVTAKGLKQGSKRFGEAAWGPVARLSGVLWLEVMGTFFGLFAFLASAGAWKQRAIFHAHSAKSQAYERFLLVSAVALLFAYFCVTSFIRAKRRERQR